MNEYVVSVRTDKNLGTEKFVRDFLGDWCRDLDPRLRPEFFDFGEPVRKPLAGPGLEQAIHAWLESSPAIMLARRSKPRFLVDVKWRRERGEDQRAFPWGITVSLAFSAGDELAELLLRFLIRHLDLAFGCITTRDEERDKHQISFKDRIGLVQKYIGLDVEETFPGVYWKTFFGAAVLSKLPSFEKLPAHRLERLSGGWLVTAYKTAQASGTKEAREAEAVIMDRLGRTRFFDKQSVDIESMKSDDQTVAMVEAAIRAKKGGRVDRAN